MLHNVKEEVQKDGSIKITASLFVSRMLTVGVPAFKMTPVPGGANPGPEAEFLLELVVPAKAVVQAAPTPPKAPTPPPASPAVVPPQHPLAK